MFLHYLKIAFRNLRKYKTQSLTGIFGLAFGLACFVPALYWLHYETSYDGFYPDAARIYRIYSMEKQSGKVNEWVPGILERKLHEYFPTTETSTCFLIGSESYNVEEKTDIWLRTLYTDSAFFRVFPQMFVCGNARQPIQTMRDIILTESAAIRLFGDVKKAIGQQVKSSTYWFPPYTVTAVVKNPPQNTNLSFDVIHFPEIMSQMTDYMPEEAQWTYFNKQMYVKLHPRTDVNELAGQLRDFTSRLETNSNIEIRMLTVGDVRHRLNTDLPFTLNFIRLFVAAGALLLFSAFFNFMNFHLDFLRQRIRELRQRTVVGATGWQLIRQMMFEMSCIILLSLTLACCFVILERPVFSGLLDIAMGIPQMIRLFVICGLSVMALMLFIGFILFWRLSRSALRHIAKGKPTEQFALRRMALTMQLTVSVVFIVSALVVMMQLRFVNRKNLGFDSHSLMYLSRGSMMMNDNQRTAIKHEFTAIPQIENMTATGFYPMQDDNRLISEVEWQGKSPSEKPVFQTISTDSHFAETFRLKMMQGEWWREGEQNKIVLNEEAVREMELREPIGTIIRMFSGIINSDKGNIMQEYEIVGVVNDFHTLSLRSRIYPTIFKGNIWDDDIPSYFRVILGQEQEAMQRITAAFTNVGVNIADVRLIPLDELYDRLNHSEQVGLKMFSVMATVCLLISLFGIYAVATASTQHRRKEIAIRKVCGAGVWDIIRIFFREYTLQVIIAGVVALPVAYLAMNRWLQGYAYRMNIPLWLLIGVVVAVAAVVLLTVLGQVLKATNRNPAEVVKSE